MEYDPDKMASYLAGKIDEYVKQQARDTILGNVGSDRAAKYARIPDGTACNWCLALGSQGFVYSSEEAAAGSEPFHPFCNCQIAVAFDSKGFGARVVRAGRDGSMQMRDYDSDALLQEYYASGRSYKKSSEYKEYASGSRYRSSPDKRKSYVAADGFPVIGAKTVRDIAKGLESQMTASFRAIKHTGDYSTVVDKLFQGLSGKGTLTAQWWAKPKGREIYVGSLLSRAGHDVELIRDYGIKGHRYPDMRIDGELWEMKSPETGNLTKIRSRIGEGKNQSRNIIVDLLSNEHYDDRMLRAIVEMLDDPEIDQMMIIVDGKAEVYK